MKALRLDYKDGTYHVHVWEAHQPRPMLVGYVKRDTLEDARAWLLGHHFDITHIVPPFQNPHVAGWMSAREAKLAQQQPWHSPFNVLWDEAKRRVGWQRLADMAEESQPEGEIVWTGKSAAQVVQDDAIREEDVAYVAAQLRGAQEGSFRWAVKAQEALHYRAEALHELSESPEASERVLRRAEFVGHYADAAKSIIRARFPDGARDWFSDEED